MHAKRGRYRILTRANHCASGEVAACYHLAAKWQRPDCGSTNCGELPSCRFNNIADQKIWPLRCFGGCMKLAGIIEALYVTGLRSAALLYLISGLMQGASLKPETVNAWDSYVFSAKAQMLQRLQPGNHFLSIDDDDGHLSDIRNGEIIVLPVGVQNPKKVSSGLIHDWIGAAFLRKTNLSDVLSTVRNYDRYKQYYQPAVLESKTLEGPGSSDHFSMLLMNKSLVLKTALESEYETSYVRVDEKRWYSISQTTRIQEIQKYGTPEQKKLRVDEGTGLIWRLLSITRFEERDGGVYVELRAIVLSRDIPASLHFFVAPIVRKASRSSLLTSLEETGEAVQLHTELAKRNGVHEQYAEGGKTLTRNTIMLKNTLR